jgi:hypothetical protein
VTDNYGAAISLFNVVNTRIVNSKFEKIEIMENIFLRGGALFFESCGEVVLVDSTLDNITSFHDGGCLNVLK